MRGLVCPSDFLPGVPVTVLALALALEDESVLVPLPLLGLGVVGPLLHSRLE